MSAILGIYSRDGRPVEMAHLDRMVASLRHRASDGIGVWSQGSIGLGHGMLWTTPESLREHLPSVDRTRGLAITADARIDNRDELIGLLHLVDRPAQEITDSDIILAAYERWGEACPEKLLGDFAFVIWDETNRKLFGARDPMGAKRFYYYLSPDIFVVGSEIKALHSVPDVPRRLNELRVAQHLARLFEDRAITFYQDVYRLPAAHSISVSPDDHRIRRYWSPDLSRQIHLRTDEDYAEALREIFTEAVRCRLRSAFPVGSMLSGGLDSSSISCVARDLLTADTNSPLHTFSAVFPNVATSDSRIDERPFMKAVLDTGGFEPHWVEADRLSPLSDLLLGHDGAIPAPNLYMDEAVFRAAHDEGVRIVLSGFDGDSTVSYGYEYLPELARTMRWRTLICEATAIARRHRMRRRDVIWRLAGAPLVPPGAWHLWEIVRGCATPPWDAHANIKQSFAQRIQLAESTRAFQPQWLTSARETHWNGLNSGLLGYAMELLDTAAASTAVEARYPFFDRRMVEYCLALPPEQKLQHGVTRAVMRRAMAGVLPPEVQARQSKSNLSASFRTKLLGLEQATIEQVIFDQSYLLDPYADVPALRAAYQRYSSEPTSPKVDQEALTVLLAVVLGLWLNRTGLGPGRKEVVGM